MLQNYNKILDNLEMQEPTPELYRSILTNIETARIRSARQRLVFFAGVALVSVAGLVSASQYVLQEFYRSGFYDYVSLIFSDSSSLVNSWKEFGLVLAESLPALALATALTMLFVLLGSLRSTVKNARVAFSNIKFI